VLEYSLEQQCRNIVKSLDGIAIKLNPVNARGIPDRLVMLPGRIMFIEFKRPGGKVRANQQHWIDRLRSMGLEAHVVDNVDQFMSIINAE